MLPCPATQQHWIKVNVCKPTEVFMENEAIKRSSTPKVLTTEGGTGWPKPFTYLSSYTSPEWVSFCNACSNISIAGAWIPLIRLTTGYNPAKIKSYGSHVFLWRYLCNKATIEVSFVSFGICERIFFSFSISTLAWSPASADMKRCPLTRDSQGNKLNILLSSWKKGEVFKKYRGFRIKTPIEREDYLSLPPEISSPSCQGSLRFHGVAIKMKLALCRKQVYQAE